MKKSYKPEILKGVLAVSTLALLMLFYVGIKLRIDYMFKEIEQLSQIKAQLNNKQLSLIVELQELSSEQRIKEIAMVELGLVSRGTSKEIIEINLEYIKEKKEELESEYE
jgi:cell division protein FtsL